MRRRIHACRVVSYSNVGFLRGGGYMHVIWGGGYMHVMLCRTAMLAFWEEEATCMSYEEEDTCMSIWLFRMYPGTANWSWPKPHNLNPKSSLWRGFLRMYLRTFRRVEIDAIPSHLNPKPKTLTLNPKPYNLRTFRRVEVDAIPSYLNPKPKTLTLNPKISGPLGELKLTQYPAT